MHDRITSVLSFVTRASCKKTTGMYVGRYVGRWPAGWTAWVGEEK